jgi:hypothetical protein
VLVLCALRPDLVGALVVLALSGMAAAHQTVAAAAFVSAVPDSARGQAYGLASTSIRVVQGLGIVLAGVAAQVMPASTVVALFGAVGVAAAVIAAISYRRSRGDVATPIAR